MTWVREAQRVLVWHEHGQPTPWRILKIGLPFNTRYELWHWPKFIATCDNVEDAKRLKDKHAGTDAAVPS